MTAETFDAVLAEMREYADDESQCFNAAERLWAIRQDELGDWADRLAAAHAAEVAERSAAFDAAKELMARDLREAESRADAATALLRECLQFVPDEDLAARVAGMVGRE